MFLIHFLINLDLNNFVYQMKLNADLQRDNLIQMDTHSKLGHNSQNEFALVPAGHLRG